MITTKKLIFLTTSFLLFLSLLYSADAKCSSPSASACGDIRNISFPFRLKSDPKHCGRSVYELSCENNVTFVYRNSIKYYVKDIYYHNSTIRLADASIKNDDICLLKMMIIQWINQSRRSRNCLGMKTATRSKN